MDKAVQTKGKPRLIRLQTLNSMQQGQAVSLAAMRDAEEDFKAMMEIHKELFCQYKGLIQSSHGCLR